MSEGTWGDDDAEAIIFNVLSKLWKIDSEKLTHTWISHKNNVIFFFSHRKLLLAFQNSWNIIFLLFNRLKAYDEGEL